MSDLALALIRAIHVAALCVIVGGLVFLVAVGRPAFAFVSTPHTAARFQRWQIRALAWALGVAVASGVAWLVAEAANMSGQPLGALVDGGGGVFGTVLTRTQFGAVWQWRAAVVPPLAAYLWLRAARATVPALIDIAAMVLAAAWIVALGWVGHAAAMGGEAASLHLAGHAVHLLAASAWLGGLPALAMLLIAAERADTPADRDLAAELTRRFSTLGVVCVTALVATGIVNAWFMLDRWAAFVDTDYGRLLLLKITLFAAMLALAARNRWQLVPRVVRGSSSAAPPAAVRELARNALVELGLGMAVIMVVGLLAVTSPPHGHAAHDHAGPDPMAAHHHGH